MKSDGSDDADDDHEQADGVLPEHLELQRTRMIVGPELNYHVRTWPVQSIAF